MSERLSKKDVERLKAKLLRRCRPTANGCWEWTTTKHSKYGALRALGKQEGAHRVSYMVHRGPIPNGMLVCHTCDNMKCVNPDHLWLGTISDNNWDRVKKGRHHNSMKKVCMRGHSFTNKNTIVRIRSYGRISRECRKCKRERERNRRANAI